MSATLEAALALVARGWPVLVVRPGGKDPLTAHGVKDATTDPVLVRRWLMRWPDANLAVATGSPGPQVLDVDDLDRARPVLLRAEALGAPVVATVRGRHYYFGGQERGTVSLPYGELRGRGSYVVTPPSIHPSGRAYVWLLEPSGPLPTVPVGVVGADATTAGCGEHEPPAGLIPYRHRHPYLKDFAVRLARAGVTDERRLLEHLRVEFELSCEPMPAPASGSLEALAEWAATTRIAGRERGVR